MKRKASIVVALAVLFVCCSIFFISSHAVAIGRFSQIEIGMTEARVQEILGAPLGIRPDKGDSTVFYYGGFRRLRWCTMEVFFGQDGQVTGKFHDH